MHVLAGRRKLGRPQLPSKSAAGCGRVGAVTCQETLGSKKEEQAPGKDRAGTRPR